MIVPQTTESHDLRLATRSAQKHVRPTRSCDMPSGKKAPTKSPSRAASKAARKLRPSREGLPDAASNLRSSDDT
eukprot:4687034-Alexandrium_andersonii.AAC.1